MNPTKTPPTPAPAHKILGYAPIDDIHRELQDLLAKTANCDGAGLAHMMQLLVCHLESHFKAEDDWMLSTDFPASECHMAEHTAVLNSAHEVHGMVQAGNTEIARSFIAELEKWFPGHADYLDSALAHWLCKRQYGGKPVMLIRP